MSSWGNRGRQQPKWVTILAYLAIGGLHLTRSDCPAAPRGESAAVEAVLHRYCADCHGPELQEAEIAVIPFPAAEALGGDPALWRRVRDMVAYHVMPPADEPQPSDAERQLVADYLAELLLGASAVGRPGGVVSARRLNRTEYNNTVRDLLGVDVRPADDFPADDVGHGFDNIADVLFVSPLLFEKYMRAAEQLAAAAIAVPDGAGAAQEKPLPDSHQKLVVAHPDEGLSLPEAARRVLAPWLRRAFRGPVAPDEVDAFVALVELAAAQGESFESGLRVAVAGALVSPRFLFRLEPPAPDAEPHSRLLSDYELASRLSYFLWSSMPDDDLMSLADRGRLQDTQVLRQQVQRMLQDDKISALVERFAGQWLNLELLDKLRPDPERYPEFDAELRESMRQETLHFVRDLIRQDRPLASFLDARHTFVNQRLADLYGLDFTGPAEAFQQVSLVGLPRQGVLTQASVLALTSNPSGTSPVKRGRWILENILGTPPPDPPADIPALEETTGSVPNATLKEKLALHRSEPMCAACHRDMDPLGLGFENFDVLGRWRTHDGEQEIDSSGTLPGDIVFSGPQQLLEILGRQQQPFRRAFVERLMVYALGRGPLPADRPARDAILERLGQTDDRMATVISEIVLSDPFRQRAPMEVVP